MKKEKIKALNDYYVRNVDKLRRMYAGVSTDLRAVKGNTLFADVRMGDGWNKPLDTSARMFANDLRRFLPELRHLTRYHVTISRTQMPAGIAVPGEELDTADGIQKLVEFMAYYARQTQEAPTEVIVIKGAFNAEDDELLQRNSRTADKQN